MQEVTAPSFLRLILPFDVGDTIINRHQQDVNPGITYCPLVEFVKCFPALGPVSSDFVVEVGVGFGRNGHSTSKDCESD